MAEAVRVEGLKELVSAFGRIDKSLRKEITDELRVLARDVRDAARSEASAQGFDPPGRSGRGTGALIKNIKYSVRGSRAFIRETATNQGYVYPAVYEYGKASPWQSGGIRSFLEPALEREHEHVVTGIERMLDRVLTGF